MYEELQYEFAEFKKDIDEGGLIFGRYFDENDYQDEYSYNEIDEFRSKFIDKVKEYLHKKARNKYVVANGWHVAVMTIEEAKKRDLYCYESLIVN